MSSRSRGSVNYGVDAPGFVRATALASLAVGAVAVGALVLGIAWLAWSAVALLLVPAAFMSLQLWHSKVAKLRARARLVDRLALEGDEMVLDVGCGRGLLLVEAARRVPAGRAVGADIWSDVDQSGNVPQAPLENARIERVDDRVEVCTADARTLPFPDGGFDAVVSQFTLHNIRDAEGRRQAIREVDRVLSPGGRLVLVDLAHTDEYLSGLRAAGWTDLVHSATTWRTFPPSRSVEGTKPQP